VQGNLVTCSWTGFALIPASLTYRVCILSLTGLNTLYLRFSLFYLFFVMLHLYGNALQPLR